MWPRSSPAMFDKPSADEALTAFIDALPTGAAVLDLGCGTGGAAAWMVQAGLAVTGWDASRGMIEKARQIAPQAKFQIAQFDELDARETYDGIWANFSLLHAPQEAFPGHLQAISQALRPKGVFHIGMKTGHGMARDGIDRRYSYYERIALEAHLADAGFAILNAREGHSLGLAGNNEPWITCLCLKT